MSRDQDTGRVVDVDPARLTVTSEEWRSGSLFLTLVPVIDDPTGWTEFRIVGVEPRVWWVTGIDGVTTDVRGDCVVVRVPLVAGDLEFTPGSY